ncbi:hypothetical protein J3459_006002 [Metarhizium acridum]|uniref:uncharacterized protein n=1 Tax=Metarhizium acridum TaxID=92637 RepID=UPI001C6B1199|nr:hypothetical protein J3458_005879 [Metarhizium acridum]KAG8428160.1 hypothetical protein J3459_006002 [Metarhizium acridum]
MNTSEDIYYFIPGLYALDPSAPEIDPDSHTWVRAIQIDDTDLMFEGKSLSSWFEDNRCYHSRHHGRHSSHSSDYDIQQE